MPPLWRWTEANYFLVMFAYCTTGLVLLGFGGKYYMASISTMATLNTIIILTNLLFGAVMPSSTPQFMVWILILMTVGIATGTGYGAYFWPRAGIVTIFLFNGYLLGVTTYTVFFGHYDFLAHQPSKITTAAEAMKIQANETSKLWLCIGVSSAICISIGLAFFDYAVIVASSVGGSFLVVRGLSLLFGGYPSEFVLYETLVNGRFFGNHGTLFLYLLVMILLAVFAVRYQLRKRNEDLQLYSYLKFDKRFQGGLLPGETGDMADQFGEYLGNWFGRAKDKLAGAAKDTQKNTRKRRGIDLASNYSNNSGSYEIAANDSSVARAKGRKKR